MRALVVDDDPDIRELARLALELMAGWEVHEAADGAEAVRVALATAPEVILLDWMMPDLDGPATLARLRAEEPLVDTPVVMLTAKAEHERRAAAAELDVAGVLAKPFDPVTLATSVAEVLAGGRAER